MGVPAKVDGGVTVAVSPFMDKNYETNRNFLKPYHYQAANFLSIVYNYDYDHLLELMRVVFVPAENGFKEAKFKIFKKNKHGDRVAEVVYTREFFNYVRQKNYHLSPSLVAYTHTDEEQSVNSIATETFIDFRRFYKGKKGEAEAAGDEEAKKAFHEIQNALKIFNNAQSGAMSSSGTPLFNHSGHTTLTSICRSLTSTANLINERLITGNRLLLSYNKTIEGFLAQLQFSDHHLIEEVIKEHNMKHATVDQVMDMVRRCANYYFSSKSKLAKIQRFVEVLTGLERTILLCVMDIRGLYTTNPKVMSQFFAEWCAVPEIPEGANADDFLKPTNGDYKILCLTKLGKNPSKLAMNHLNEYHVSLESKWSKFIMAFFRSRIPPTGIYDVKEIVRESVMTSDTDSVIYSVDMVIENFAKDEETEIRFNGVLTYFIRCIAVDQHAKLSVNMNVAKKFQHRLHMKNEFLYTSYFTTNMSKHYFMLELMCEGVMHDAAKLEMKGVHLKGVKIAELVRNFTKKVMRLALDTLYNKQKLCAATLLKEVGDIERALIDNISNGGWLWLRKDNIKHESVYSTPDSSIYYYHKMWTNVLSPKYGEAPQLPYKAYKVNLDLDGKKKMATFIESIEDANFKAIAANFFKDRDGLSSLYVPTDMIEAMGGIPKEFLPFVDIRQVIQQNLKSVYAILESFGLFILNAKKTRLVSDEH